MESSLEFKNLLARTNYSHSNRFYRWKLAIQEFSWYITTSRRSQGLQRTWHWNRNWRVPLSYPIISDINFLCPLLALQKPSKNMTVSFRLLPMISSLVKVKTPIKAIKINNTTFWTNIFEWVFSSDLELPTIWTMDGHMMLAILIHSIILIRCFSSVSQWHRYYNYDSHDAIASLLWR